MTQSTDLQLSIIVIGESGVGKSSLCKKFSGENKSVCGPTVVASSWQKNIVVSDVKVKLVICDAGGQEAFRNNLTSYFDKKDGVLAVYDISNKDTFQKLSLWLDLVKQYNNDFVTLIVGNKSDCSNKRSVKRSDVVQFGKEHDLSFMETSAKDGSNVEKVFEYLVLKLFLKKKILSEDKLNLVSSTILLYESPVFGSSCSPSAQKWVEDISKTSPAEVCEEEPSPVQDIPTVNDSEKTLQNSTDLPQHPRVSLNDGTEPTSHSQISEKVNRNEGPSAIDASCSSRTSQVCNELPPIVPLTDDEIVELYVQRQRKMSSSSISSLATWDSPIVLEYEAAIRQYEAARAETARKNPDTNCTLL